MNSVTNLLLNNPDLNPWEANNNFDYDQSMCVKGTRDTVESDHQVKTWSFKQTSKIKISVAAMWQYQIRFIMQRNMTAVTKKPVMQFSPGEHVNNFLSQHTLYIRHSDLYADVIKNLWYCLTVWLMSSNYGFLCWNPIYSVYQYDHLSLSVVPHCFAYRIHPAGEAKEKK